MVSALKSIIAEHYDLYARYGEKNLSGIIFSYGHNLCLGGQMKEGRAELVKAIRANPRNLKAALALVTACSGARLYRLLYRLIIIKY
jgi:hypothetical protein